MNSVIIISLVFTLVILIIILIMQTITAIHLYRKNEQVKNAMREANMLLDDLLNTRGGGRIGSQ